MICSRKGKYEGQALRRLQAVNFDSVQIGDHSYRILTRGSGLYVGLFSVRQKKDWELPEASVVLNPEDPTQVEEGLRYGLELRGMRLLPTITPSLREVDTYLRGTNIGDHQIERIRLRITELLKERKEPTELGSRLEGVI